MKRAINSGVLDKKGFYIVLLLCIVVVAGTAVYVTSRRSLNTKPEYESENPLEYDADDIAVEDAATNTADKLTDLDPDDMLVSRPDEMDTDIEVRRLSRKTRYWQHEKGYRAE